MMLFDLFRSKSRSGSRPVESSPRHDASEKSLRHKQRSPRHVDDQLGLGAEQQAGDHRQPRLSSTVKVALVGEDPLPVGTSVPTWPPNGFASDDSLSEREAKDLIATGVPLYCGTRHPIPHASPDYFALYAACEGVPSDSDGAKVYNPAFSAVTFQVSGPGLARLPSATLEQPSLAFCYGDRPGTVTLNHWTTLFSRLRPSIELRDPGVRPREVDLSTIMDRLISLEGGLEEDREDLMYKNLYKKFIRDRDRYLNPHKAMEKQIADLITVLSGPQWIDFSDPRNQIVAKFFVGARFAEETRYKQFFYQLLLSIELDIRINSTHHAEVPKQKLLAQLPPCIGWDLALSRKWRDCMRIERFREINGSEQIRFILQRKKRQVKAIRKFARAMKWPNLAEVDEAIRSKDPSETLLENRSSDAMSYFSGVILPGITLPFLLMNTLVDCDRDCSIAAITHMHPHCGFQYRSTTYWSSTCIVGKVLAPSCREIAGWIGPAISTPDLERIQVVGIRQRNQRQTLRPKEVQSMSVRSDPLGPPPSNNSYPVREYQLILPDIEDLSKAIRVERLSLKPTGATLAGSGTPNPGTFDASIQFAIDGISWPLRLSFDVSYISAYPCAGGPHPLFYDYVYKAVKVDEILTINDWGAFGNSRDSGGSLDDSDENNDLERVLVVEAFGVPDNEILARAWASHWGLNAIVADHHKTCMACAIREAYAACLNVVILVGGTDYHSM